MVTTTISLLEAIVLILVNLSDGGQMPRIIYVDKNSPGGDGRSWQTAYRELHEVLYYNSPGPLFYEPVEIRIAQGIYRVPGSPPYRPYRFRLYSRAVVVVKGGYAGLLGQDPNARDIARYKTILTGDYNGDDLPLRRRRPTEYLVFGQGNRLDNACCVLYVATAEGAVLDGVTITGGCRDGSWCSVAPGGPVGSGMVIVNSHNVSLVDCTFIGNWAKSDGTVVIINSNVTFTRCRFIGNHHYSAGTILVPYGTNNLRLIDCDFIDNYAEYVGGVAISAADTTIWASNCRFIANWSARLGGSLVSIGGTNSKAVFTNCLFTGNRVDRMLGGGRIELRNCIVWGNSSLIGTIIDWKYVKVLFSVVEGGWRGVAYIPNTGIIDVDPLFARPGYWDENGTPDDPYDDIWIDGDYHLKSQAGRWDPVSQSWVIDDLTSPCIDAGDPNSPVGLEPFPNGGRINMGAYGGTAEASKSYFGGPVCQTIVAGDINGDCIVDAKDLAILASHWLERWEYTESRIPPPPQLPVPDR